MMGFIHPRLRVPAGIALAGTAFAAAWVGLAVTVAIKGAPWWPFLVILAIRGFGYVFGLSAYGSGAADPADAPGAPHDVRSPVSG